MMGVGGNTRIGLGGDWGAKGKDFTGTMGLHLYDERGRSAAQFAMPQGQPSALALLDGNGIERLTVRLDPDGHPAIVLRGNDENGALMYVDNDGSGAFGIHGKGKKGLAIMSIDKAGKPELELIDREGRRIRQE